MDLSSEMSIKQEKELLTLGENLDFNCDVKIEEIPILGDWSITNGELENYENHEQSKVVSYDKLKNDHTQKCPKCCQWFSDSYELIKHNLKHFEIATEKLLLPTTFQQVEGKKRAKKNGRSLKEKDIFIFECEKCDSNFKRLKDLNKHIKYIHDPKEVACTLCSTKLTNKDALKTHMRNCHSEKVYCDICDSKLKSLSYLHAHMRRVHYDDGKVHSCDICNKIFKSPRYLRIHLKNSHRVVSNKTVEVRKKRRTKGKCNNTMLNEIDEFSSMGSSTFEEPVRYEIELPYEVAMR